MCPQNSIRARFSLSGMRYNKQQNQESAAMDPRPYHFEYRRPRLANPTYQSTHLYDSIYQIKQNNNQRNPEAKHKSFSLQEPTEMKRANSTDISTKKMVEIENIGTYRYNSKGNIQPMGKGSARQSVMASYGNNLVNNLVKNTPMDQAQIYKRQEKEFNIISFYPKQIKPSLRQFPKLTMEDRLIEKKNKQPIFQG